MNVSHLSRTTYHLVGIGGLLLTLVVARANAAPEIPPASPRTATSPPSLSDQAKAIVQADRAAKVLQLPLSLSVENAKVEDVAGRVQKSIVKARPQLSIEVRDARPLRLSFAVKAATVGDVLRSVAMLSGVQLWVFNDHLLLAPPTSLSREENEAVSQSSAFLYASSPAEKENLGQSRRKALASFIADEIKGLHLDPALAASKPNLFGPRDTLGQTTFSQLSPEAQAVVQILVTSMKESSLAGRSPVQTLLAGFNLSAGTFVQLDSRQGGTIQMTFPGHGNMRWETSGNGWGFGTGGDTPPRSPTPPVFVDPSAGKS